MRRILLLFAWMACILVAHAQNGQFDLRFVTESIDCESDFVFVRLEIKANNPVNTFNVGHLNIRFTFNHLAVTNPVIAEEGVLSGLATTADPFTFTFYQPHTLTGSAGNLVSYNLYMGGGSGYPLSDSEWVSIGSVRFSILDPTACLDLVFNTYDPFSFPNSTVIERFNNFYYLVDEGNYTDLDLCLAETCVPPPEEPEFDLRFRRVDIDCTEEKVFIDLQIKASTINSSFNLAFMNLRFTFNDLVVTNPVLDQELGFNGFLTTNSPPTFSIYSTHTLTGSTGNQISYNVSLAGGDGFPVPQNWTSIGRIAFDIIEYQGCMKLNWNEFDEFPSTLVVEKDQNTFLPVTEANFKNFSSCLGSACLEFRNLSIAPVESIQLMPVPVQQYLQVQFESLDATESVISVYDMQGRVVYREALALQDGFNQALIDMNQQAPGNYVFVLESGDYRYSELFVKISP